MSTAGLELSSFINPELTWKTVSKGRNTSRRSRRPVMKDSKMGHEQNHSPKKMESQVSESVKVSGIARRFGDSMEHIPIKKRRFVLRSPSPPPQSPRDESGELEKSSCVFDQLTMEVQKKLKNDSSNVETLVRDADDSTSDGKKLKATDEVCGCGDDFSGIAMLAAAACIDMLDKPSANTTSAFDESVTNEQISLPKEHIIDDSLRASFSVTSQTTEQTKASPASRDDRLHWDLNAPMDEWGDPLDDTHDTTVDCAMELQTESVDCLVKKEQADVCTIKEPTLQPRTGGLNSSEAPSGMTPSVSATQLARKGDFHTGNSGLITGEALPELTHNASNIGPGQVVDGVGTFQQHHIGPSSGMKDKLIPSGVVDRVGIVDHCLRLGSNDTKTSLSQGKLTVTASDLQDVAKEGSASAMQVDNKKKSEMGLMLKSVSMEVGFDIDRAPCEVTKNSAQTLKSDEIKNELPELPFHPFQHYPMPSEKQGLALPTMGASVLEAHSMGFNNVSKDLAEMCKCSEIKTEIVSAMDQPSDANQLDAKKCETKSMQTSYLEEEPCSIPVSRYEDLSRPGKKNEFGCTSGNFGDVAQPVDKPCPVGSESTIIDLKHADISCHSNKSEDGGASSSNVGKSAKTARGVEAKNESVIVVGYEPQIHMKMENTLAVKVDDNQDTAPSSQLEEVPCEDSSDRTLALQVANEECGQILSTGLEGGYDSYLEDGELREHHWVDNGDKNRENEHVDYDFDQRDDHKFTGAGNGPIAEKVVAVVCEKQGNQLHEHLRCDDQLPAFEKNIEEDHSYPHHTSFLAGDAGEDSLKAIPSTSNSVFTNQLSAMDNPEVVDMDLDDGRKSTIVSDDHKEDQNDCFKDIGDVYIEGVGMKDSRREMQSQLEGPFSSYRRGTHFAPRSRYSNFNRSYYRDERQIGVDESLGRGRSLHPDYGGRVGSRYWNRGLRNVGSDPATEGADDKFVGPSDDESLGGHQQGMFPGSRGGYTHLARKGSPAGRAEEYDMGLVKGRDVNLESGQRNRYDRNLTGLSRGPREGYRGPIYETPNSSSSMPNHFMKTERSFSPGGSRIDGHPPRSRRRSRSRSRTHSPDLRPDDRMGRMRAPYQNADYFRERRTPFRVFGQGQRFDTSSGRLRSENCVRPGTRPVRFLDGPPSGRPHEYENDDDSKRKTYAPRSYRRSRSKSRSCSPEFRNDARMGRMRPPPYTETSHTRDHMTDRRSSPPRMFHSGKRFDTVDSPPTRPRSGDYMRPIARPIRFQDNAQPSRGNEYEGDDYRRKPRTIFDRIRPTRNYDMEGDGRRFEYDAEDGSATQTFNRGDAYMRGAERRPADVVRGGAREEASNTRYNSDRIYSTGPKPFGNREYSDDALPRRMRPE